MNTYKTIREISKLMVEKLTKEELEKELVHILVVLSKQELKEQLEYIKNKKPRFICWLNN